LVQIEKPGILAAAIELELERLRHARAVAIIPPSLVDLAEALGRVAAMLREAHARGQTVDLADGIVALLREFRAALGTLGAPSQA
jgi:hypothetical protein